MGISLDAKFNEGNTLLHFAVALDMYDQVVYLLEAGANYLITNKEGLSPRDIALEAGNQRVLCLFRRESWYRLYTHAGNENYNPDKDSREHNAQVLSQIAQPAVGFADLSYSFWINNGFVGVSENFLDWTDSQICTHLQVGPRARHNAPFICTACLTVYRVSPDRTSWSSFACKNRSF